MGFSPICIKTKKAFVKVSKHVTSIICKLVCECLKQAENTCMYYYPFITTEDLRTSVGRGLHGD